LLLEISPELFPHLVYEKLRNYESRIEKGGYFYEDSTENFEIIRTFFFNTTRLFYLFEIFCNENETDIVFSNQRLKMKKSYIKDYFKWI